MRKSAHLLNAIPEQKVYYRMYYVYEFKYKAMLKQFFFCRGRRKMGFYSIDASRNTADDVFIAHITQIEARAAPFSNANSIIFNYVKILANERISNFFQHRDWN